MKKIIIVVEEIFQRYKDTQKAHRYVQTHRAFLGEADLQVSRIYQLDMEGAAKQPKEHRGLLSVTGKWMEGTPDIHPATWSLMWQVAAKHEDKPFSRVQGIAS